MTALHRKLWRDLKQLRGQVIAISLVMVGGIGTMVMAQTNYAALAGTRALYYAEHRFAEVFARVKRAPLPLVESVRTIPGVREAEPRVMGFVTLEIAGYEEPVTGQMVSLPRPGDPGLNRVFLRAGRLPAADDEAVLGELFAEAHGLRPGDPVTAIMNGRRQRLTVSGIGLSPEFIYQIRPGDVFPDFERFGVLWMPYEPLAMAFDMDGAFNDLSLTLTREAREQDVVDALDLLLRPYGGAGAHGRDLQLSHRFLDEELGQLQIMTRLFSAIFLGVTAFLLNVVIGRLISTQREQIAVLKAYGYSRFEVSLHYAQLALLMVLVGVPAGLALGAWLGRGMADIYMDFYRFPYLAWSVEPFVVALAFAFALAAAAIGTAGGLARVFRLPPAEAMRPEAPPVYRRSLAERAGLAALLDPAARMILRNLGRRPLRTLMSVLGIGLGTGILVLSRFQGGAIEQMVDVQFGFAQRDDFAVTFTEPASARAAQELAALPGVRAVEPFRSAAVRLRHGHREYRTALQGLPDDADLKRVLDAELRPAPLPEDGLLLTDYLADMLRVRPGDRIDVEFLEGHRRTLSVPVAGTVHEYLGVGAYARREVVNRLLGEGAALSGAWLALEGGARAGVIRELRARPRVAAVTDRAATVQSFRDTMAESILTFTLIATLMAASIAVGVVYNDSRITLAERGRELASLRVLGYTRGEVRALLVGELFTLAFLALVPGFLLGVGMVYLLIEGFASDLYRIPLAVEPSGFAIAGLVVLAATALSGALVRRRLDALDLVAVLKLKE
ncbi:MAG: ABC transporter permease [Steroidobacteraceae bacterium]|nr:ABC transporter permease [Steroidobacteraceae bacterium]